MYKSIQYPYLLLVRPFFAASSLLPPAFSLSALNHFIVRIIHQVNSSSGELVQFFLSIIAPNQTETWPFSKFDRLAEDCLILSGVTIDKTLHYEIWTIENQKFSSSSYLQFVSQFTGIDPAM